MQSVTIEKNQAGQRLDKFLKKYLPEAGTSFLYKMLRKKNITLNAKKAEGKEILAVGDTVCFFFSDETFAKFTGNFVQSNSLDVLEYQKAYKTLQNIKILYEDENVLIADKPAGILTQKAQPSDLSLNEWLIGYLLSTKAISEEELYTFHPSVCNRLDRNTSGIVLCGKSLEGSQLLSKLIKERTVRKFYRTICVGQISEAVMLEGYLVKNNATNKVSISKTPVTDAAYIKTGFCPLVSNKAYTLLEVELITGKTHQIRAHLASEGHPIIGDRKYGNKKANISEKDNTELLKSQLLHAYCIVFPGDDTIPEALRGKEIIAPYPVLFEKMIYKLELGK